MFPPGRYWRPLPARRWKKLDEDPLGRYWHPVTEKGEEGTHLCSRQGGTDILRRRWSARAWRSQTDRQTASQTDTDADTDKQDVSAFMQAQLDQRVCQAAPPNRGQGKRSPTQTPPKGGGGKAAPPLLKQRSHVQPERKYLRFRQARMFACSITTHVPWCGSVS